MSMALQEVEPQEDKRTYEKVYGQPDVQIHEIFGEVISSPHHQHLIVIMIGKTGTGKSNASLDLAYKTSVYMANKLGGVPEDYFTMDNVAIISMESIIEVMKGMKYRNIYILDDIGTGWNARDFAKKKNKIMNNIIQTFRKYETLLILTLPDTFLIDSVPRNLLHYQIEMDQQRFDMGLTIGKIFSVVRKYRKGQNHYHYLVINGVKYERCVFERAPKHIVDAYEAVRTEIQEAEQAKQLAELEEMTAELDGTKEKDTTPKVTTKDRILELRRDVNAGVYETLKEACYLNDINYKYARNVS
jgi:hypothetical protein